MKKNSLKKKSENSGSINIKTCHLRLGVIKLEMQLTTSKIMGTREENLYFQKQSSLKQKECKKE